MLHWVSFGGQMVDLWKMLKTKVEFLNIFTNVEFLKIIKTSLNL
jgi:hypothetical protein